MRITLSVEPPKELHELKEKLSECDNNQALELVKEYNKKAKLKLFLIYPLPFYLMLLIPIVIPMAPFLIGPIFRIAAIYLYVEAFIYCRDLPDLSDHSLAFIILGTLCLFLITASVAGMICAFFLMIQQDQVKKATESILKIHKTDSGKR